MDHTKMMEASDVHPPCTQYSETSENDQSKSKLADPTKMTEPSKTSIDEEDDGQEVPVGEGENKVPVVAEEHDALMEEGENEGPVRCKDACRVQGRMENFL